MGRGRECESRPAVCSDLHILTTQMEKEVLGPLRCHLFWTLGCGRAISRRRHQRPRLFDICWLHKNLALTQPGLLCLLATKPNYFPRSAQLRVSKRLCTFPTAFHVIPRRQSGRGLVRISWESCCMGVTYTRDTWFPLCGSPLLLRGHCNDF